MRQQNNLFPVHEGQLLNVSKRKQGGREREFVFAQAVFLSRRPCRAVLQTWQIGRASETLTLLNLCFCQKNYSWNQDTERQPLECVCVFVVQI